MAASVPMFWCVAAAVAGLACGAVAGERRDLVFDCPCVAEWAAGQDGERGTLTLSGGVRSLRATASGEIRVTVAGEVAAGGAPGGVPAGGRLRARWTLELAEPESGAVLELDLEEAVGVEPGDAAQWHRHETLALWPVPTSDGSPASVFVDILTDADGDGVGDMNERLAGTSPEDPASRPDDSVIDVLVFFSAAYRDEEGGYPQTRLLHELTVAEAIFEDSGTGIRLRIVGMREEEPDQRGWVPEDRRGDLMASYGADVTIQAGGPCNCAGVGAARAARWRDAEAAVYGGPGSALVTAHELGHVMGLAHSARQGETYGAFRWSRGHYLTPRGAASDAWSAHGYGTVMTYGDHRRSGGFSNPQAQCGDVPCGVPQDEIDGASAVDTLNLLRFQIAAHRDSAPDSDGDGFVDAGDALPDDPNDWFDADGDGIGDNADPDDDNDGTPDADDPFPVDPSEWADADRDGIGDNADAEVAVLDPFRDPALRAAIERELGKAPGEAIAAEEMASLRELHLGREGIRDLAGLELATGLEYLGLPYNDVADLAPLSGLAELADLDLRSNEVVDLTPLAGLRALERLVLADNPVRDIAALAGLDRCLDLDLGDTGVAFGDVRGLPFFHRLEHLGVAGLGIRDASALAGLPLRSLGLARNPLSDAAPLSSLISLVRLDLAETGLTEVEPLRELAALVRLDLGSNAIADIRPLAGLAALRVLHLENNRIAEVQALAGLDRLEIVDIDRNRVTDLGPLAGLPALWRLEAAGNRITDASALAALDNLQHVDLGHNAIADVAPLAGLPEIHTLALSANAITDISALSGHPKISQLLLDGNAVENIEAIGTLARLEYLLLAGNRISDVAPLSRLTGLERLDLRANAIANIAPLVDRSIFGGRDSWLASVQLTGNPLDDVSVDEHIPALEAWDVRVEFRGPGAPVAIDDPTLRSLVAEAVAGQIVHVDDASGWPFGWLAELHLMGRGIASLAGLEPALALKSLYAASNRIADLAPLGGLRELARLDLRDNRIADLAPLVANDALGDGDWVALDGNPLSETALNEQIPALLERGVEVGVDRIALILVAGGADRRFDTAGYFEALLGAGVETQVAVDDPTLATAAMSAGTLVLTPGPAPGTATATVTATGADGTVATLDFVATIRGPARAPRVASARDAMREGFVRVVNRSAQAGVVGIAAVDDAGSRRRGISLAIGGGEARHFNSADLEAGNPDKHLTGSAGRGSGDWRLEFETALEVDVLTYVRTTDGFLTAMHDTAAAAAGRWQVPTFNPASNARQISSLLISNLAAEDAVAAITGIDDAGASPGGEVRIGIPAGATVALAATELEAGSARLTGSLGNGAGKWRLAVESAGELAIASLLASPEGHLSNLSTVPIPPDADGVVTVGLFASAGVRQGFVRIVNRSAQDGEIRIDAYDDLGRRAEPVTLAIGARRTIHFNSDDLELGNAEKGLSGRTGAGSGDWRLELRSALDIDVLVYVRTPGGFLAAMHDVVARQGRRYDVAMFNPGSNASQASRLRIVNPGARPAYVSIAGVDDKGRSPGDVARLTLAPGTARTISAAQLEQGTWGVAGRLGDGTGKWRLRIDCEQPVLIMNLMESASGHLTNLSSAGPR